MRARAVVGANFGDEGKGLVVDWLCSKGAGCVVRFNGGANAGHTVVSPEGRHVFSHFGSGTLLGVPTYLSRFFVCNPILFFQELRALRSLGVMPAISAHPDCIVTTHIDMLINQEKEAKRGSARHGSCGVGIHETHQRSQVDRLRLTLGDLWGEGSIEGRLKEIGTVWSRHRVGREFHSDAAVEDFVRCAKLFAEYVQPSGFPRNSDPVFEGAQGLMLDQDNTEYAPHLTHSHTGTKNVRVLCSQAGLTPEVYYVSRTYLTRHGAGRLPGEDPSLRYHDDTNRSGAWQGDLRFAPLDSGLLGRIAKDSDGLDSKLVLTHCDQLKPSLDADFLSFGPTRSDVHEYGAARSMS